MTDIRMIMKLLAIAVLTASLSACGGGSSGGGDPGGEDPPPPPPPPTTFSVGGTIEYLAGTSGQVVLKLNGDETLTVTNGAATFEFTTALANGAAFEVTAESYSVEGTSIGWECTAGDDASGTIAGADVTNIVVSCGRDIRLNSFGAHATDQGVITLLYQAEDSEGTPVSGLTIDDFLVEQDGNAIHPTESFKEIVPNTDLSYELDMVVMVDISGSISPAELAQVRSAVRGLVVDGSSNSRLLPNQRVAVWVFDGDVTQIQDFTDDHELLAEQIDTITQLGRADLSSTNLYGAAITGVNQWADQFSANAIKQGFLVLITDGDDTSDKATLSQALAARGSKRVYTVAVGTDISQDGQNALLELGNAGYLTANTFDLLGARLQEAAQDLADLVDSFYYLHYATPSRNGDHTVEVSVLGNVYTGQGASLSGIFTANNDFGVSAEVVLNDTVLNVAPEGSVNVRARVRWDNADSYDYAWSTIPNRATVEANATDGSRAVLTGVEIAGIDSLTVGTLDRIGNEISVQVPVYVTEVSMAARSRILSRGESIELTASSSNETPSFIWSETTVPDVLMSASRCSLNTTAGSTVTLTAPSANDVICRVSVSDSAGSGTPYVADFVVGAPGTTPISVVGSVPEGNTYSFESGTVPSVVTMGGDADWVIDASTGANGTSYSMRAGAITHNQSSEMSITVADASEVTFWYKVDSEGGYDYLTFRVNGTTVMSRSGSWGWTSYTYGLSGTGPHTLTWRYAKDNIVSVGADTAWVDEITIQ